LLVGAAGSASSSTAEERAIVQVQHDIVLDSLAHPVGLVPQKGREKHPHAPSADPLVAEGPVSVTGDLAKINEDYPQFFASIVALPVDLGRKSR
jgi:hypothetical protein